MAKQKSYRDLIAEGTASRVNAMKFRIGDIHEQPGFNLREEGEDLEESVRSLAEYIAAGGTYPPIEIRIREEGGVWVVDGHRRRRAVLRAIEMGAPLQDKAGDVWMNVTAFEGNDVDRAARLLTSNESKTLTDLERANGYKRLASFGLSPSDIAAKVGRSRPHVEQLLMLANANKDVQDLVRGGKVSATSAIETVRKHGEKAGQELGEKVAANGGGRVTEGMLKPKALPKTVLAEMEASILYVASSLNRTQRKALALAEKNPEQHANDPVEIPAGTLLEILNAFNAIEAARLKQAEKDAAKAQAAGQQTIEEIEE